MADQRVVNYIKEQLSRGFAAEQIRQGLLSQGWQEAIVGEAMRIVAGSGGMNPGNAASTSQSPVSKEGVPGLVKFLAILYFISAAGPAFGGFQMVTGGGIFAVFLGALGPSIGTIIIIAGILMFLLAILYIFVGIGMWKGQKWSRIVAIIFSVIGFLGGIYIFTTNIISGAISVIISGGIGSYLIASKKVKEAFS